jgi:hypothetical protein
VPRALSLLSLPSEVHCEVLDHLSHYDLLHLLAMPLCRAHLALLRAHFFPYHHDSLFQLLSRRSELLTGSACMSHPACPHGLWRLLYWRNEYPLSRPLQFYARLRVLGIGRGADLRCAPLDPALADEMAFAAQHLQSDVTVRAGLEREMTLIPFVCRTMRMRQLHESWDAKRALTARRMLRALGASRSFHNPALAASVLDAPLDAHTRIPQRGVGAEERVDEFHNDFAAQRIFEKDESLRDGKSARLFRTLRDHVQHQQVYFVLLHKRWGADGSEHEWKGRSATHVTLLSFGVSAPARCLIGLFAVQVCAKFCE